MRKLILVVVLFLMTGSVQANNTLPEAVIGVSPARDWFYNLEDVFFDSGDSSDPNGYISYTKWYINGVLHTSGSYWRNMSECFALYGSPSNGCYELGVGETTVEIELRVQDNSGNWDIETKVITIREYKGRKYFIKDHLGSVRTTVTREDGKVLGYDDYYPFGLSMPGRSSNSTNSNDNYKFTGHERDEEASLTLDYMMARNYDPMIGRFLQIDPLADQFPGWTPYHYVHNNPLNLTDPTGMKACKPPEDCPTDYSDLSDAQKVGVSIAYQLISIKHATYNLILKPFFGKEATFVENEKGGLVTGFVDYDVTKMTTTEAVGDYIGDGFEVLSAVGGGGGTTGILAKNGAKQPIISTIEEQASDLVSLNGGRNRVTLNSTLKRMEVDLAGRAHGNVPTPHIKVSTRNTRAPNQPAYNTKEAIVRPVTQEEVRAVRKYLEKITNN